MTSADLLVDGFDRIKEVVHRAVRGLGPDELAFRVDPAANSIGWLVWHLTRVQDDHLADVAGIEQVYTSQGFARRFDLPFDDAQIGYGHSSDEVAAVRVSDPGLLTAYHDATYEQTVRFVRTVTDDDLPKIIDTRWDPPVTLGVRLISVINDGTQHAGQAAFVRGIVDRRG